MKVDPEYLAKESERSRDKRSKTNKISNKKNILRAMKIVLALDNTVTNLESFAKRYAEAKATRNFEAVNAIVTIVEKVYTQRFKELGNSPSAMKLCEPPSASCPSRRPNCLLCLARPERASALAPTPADSSNITPALPHAMGTRKRTATAFYAPTSGCAACCSTSAPSPCSRARDAVAAAPRDRRRALLWHWRHALCRAAPQFADSILSLYARLMCAASIG